MTGWRFPWKLIKSSGSVKSAALYSMKATQLLHDLGQSLWLDNIIRDLLNKGTLQHRVSRPAKVHVPKPIVP
jgi:hypothetical protein